MAMTTTTGAAPAAPAQARAGNAPGWILVAYLGGLFLVYAGQRILAGSPTWSTPVTALGLIATTVATALRFSPSFRAGGERKSIETLLAVLSVLGLLGVLAYFTTSDFGIEKFKLDQLPSDKRVRIEEFVRVLWVSLIAISVVPMVFAETALRPMRNAARPEFRRVRSAALAGLSLALAGVYGALFVYAASGVDLKIDYSYFKTSKPSESTKKLVSTLTGDPIRVVAFFPDVNEVRNEVEGYLREVAGSSQKIKVEIVDRLLVPKLSKDLRITQDGMIAITRGGVTNTLTIGTDLDQARPKLKTLDRDFQEQLLKIAKSKRTAYLTVGHGEINDVARGRSDGGRSAQIVRTLLQKQNYTIKDLGLAQGLANDVPEDADVVLVLGPTNPFAREEIASLERYAARGGRLVLALDPDAIASQDQLAGKAPDVTSKDEAQKDADTKAAAATKDAKDAVAKTDVSKADEKATTTAAAQGEQAAGSAAATFNKELARIAGVEFDSTVLANEKQHVRLRYNDSDRTRLISNSFSSHASVSTLSRNAPRAAVVLFGAGSLKHAEGATGKVDFAVRSMANTFQDTNGDYRLQSGTENSGIFNMAAAVSRPITDASKKPEPKKDDKKDKDAKTEEPKEFRAFVLADADALSDFVMGEVLGNQILFVDAVRWLVGEESVQGLPNTEEDVRIEHTKQADLGWFYALILGAPTLVLGAGLFVSYRSRARGSKR